MLSDGDCVSKATESKATFRRVVTIPNLAGRGKRCLSAGSACQWSTAVTRVGATRRCGRAIGPPHLLCYLSGVAVCILPSEGIVSAADTEARLCSQLLDWPNPLYSEHWHTAGNVFGRAKQGASNDDRTHDVE